MKEDKITDALKINKMRCILAIVVCSLLCLLIFIAVSNQLLQEYDPIVNVTDGWKTYHTFTVMTNLFMALAAAMCLPYAVDGLRQRNYHLPRWCVVLLYTAATSLALTFLFSLLVLSPLTSFKRMMFSSSNLLLHTLCPLLSVVLFLFINSDHEVKFRSAFIAVMPIVCYSLLYYVLVFMIGENAGGWIDHYHIGELVVHLPLIVFLAALFLFTFLLADLLRRGHNAIHRKRKKDLSVYYQRVMSAAYPDIRSAIAALAAVNRANDSGGELIIPRRILLMLEDKYHSQLSTEELCQSYLQAYYSK